MDQNENERIQKVLSEYGIASRRTAENYIMAGRVTVNGSTAVLGMRANPNRDEIALDGIPIDGKPEKIYLMLNKPRGYVSTLSDEHSRKTVAELVADCGFRVWPVGRLDMYSEGLLLFTNDGAFTRIIEHPGSNIEKEYLLRIAPCPEQAIRRLRGDFILDGVHLSPAEIDVLNRSEKNTLLRVVIHEGKNRQIRRMCDIAGCHVLRLKRVREGSIRLGNLQCGTWRKLTRNEIFSI